MPRRSVKQSLKLKNKKKKERKKTFYFINNKNETYDGTTEKRLYFLKTKT